jgi:TolB-like protein
VIFRFGSYALDAERHELTRSGKRAALERQVFDILLYFLENRHRVVTRDDVLRAVWRGRLVSESTLSSRITAVRQAIGDSGARQRLIRTVTRGGYRFVGAVTVSRPPGRPVSASDITVSAGDKPSVLIVPFANLSGDAGQDRFLVGLADELTTALIRFRQFVVVPRSIVPPSQGADAARGAAECGVRYVLHGSFRREGGHVRISAQLTDACAQNLLWADRYDCRAQATFELQDQITARLVSAIVPQLEAREHQRLKAEPAGEPDAYALTLAGVRSLRQWTRPGIDRALRLFHQAITTDREFAPAYAMSSYCHVQKQSYGWFSDSVRERAEGAALARAAAELGADNALTLTRAAHAISVLDNDVDGGAVLAERALKLNPLLDDAWYVSGWTMLIAGKPKLAHERLLRARQLSAHDHLIFKIDAASAYALFFTGRYDDATDAAMSALRTRPNYLTAFRIAAASDVLAGRTEQGRRFVAKMRAVDPKLRLSGLPEILPFRRREDFDRWAGALQVAGLPD